MTPFTQSLKTGKINLWHQKLGQCFFWWWWWGVVNEKAQNRGCWEADNVVSSSGCVPFCYIHWAVYLKSAYFSVYMLYFRKKVQNSNKQQNLQGSRNGNSLDYLKNHLHHLPAFSAKLSTPLGVTTDNSNSINNSLPRGRTRGQGSRVY